MPHRQNTLPTSFKAIDKASACVYNCKREPPPSAGTFKVTWEYNGNNASVYYAEATLKEIIYRDCKWRIMEDTKKQLPESFKFYFHYRDGTKQDVLYTATLCDGFYLIDWEGRKEGLKTYAKEGKVFVEKHVERGWWRIVECSTEDPVEETLSTIQTNVTLESIKEFCKAFEVDVVISPYSYDVLYGNEETAHADTDEELQQIMGAISVLYGEKFDRTPRG